MGKCFIMLIRIEWLGRTEVLENVLHCVYVYRTNRILSFSWI